MSLVIISHYKVCSDILTNIIKYSIRHRVDYFTLGRLRYWDEDSNYMTKNYYKF